MRSSKIIRSLKNVKVPNIICVCSRSQYHKEQDDGKGGKHPHGGDQEDGEHPHGGDQEEGPESEENIVPTVRQSEDTSLE